MFLIFGKKRRLNCSYVLSILGKNSLMIGRVDERKKHEQMTLERWSQHKAICTIVFKNITEIVST